VPGQHFPRDLRIARLIGADQAKISKAKEKKEAAAGSQQKPVRD
jgi:hypothetical protein